MMADLVAEMAQQRAVRLVHAGAPIFALGIVGFAQGNGDDAVVVAGHHPLAGLGIVGEEAEGKAMLAVLVTCVQRQVQPDQGIEQALLGALNGLPAAQIGRIGQVWDGFVVPTGGAIDVATRLGRDQPVAGAMRGVGTKHEGVVVNGRRTPEPAILDQRDECGPARQIPQLMAAALADRVLKIDRVATMGAGKQFHRSPSTSQP